MPLSVVVVVGGVFGLSRKLSSPLSFSRSSRGRQSLKVEGGMFCAGLFELSNGFQMNQDELSLGDGVAFLSGGGPTLKLVGGCEF